MCGLILTLKFIVWRLFGVTIIVTQQVSDIKLDDLGLFVGLACGNTPAELNNALMKHCSRANGCHSLKHDLLLYQCCQQESMSTCDGNNECDCVFAQVMSSRHLQYFDVQAS